MLNLNSKTMKAIKRMTLLLALTLSFFACEEPPEPAGGDANGPYGCDVIDQEFGGLSDRIAEKHAGK